MLANYNTAMKNTVSITEFNKGYAGKIFDDARKSGPKLVMRNNTPAAIVLAPADYSELMEALEDAELELLAMQRLQHEDPDTYLSHDDILKEFGVTREELAAMDQVELE